MYRFDLRTLLMPEPASPLIPCAVAAAVAVIGILILILRRRKENKKRKERFLSDSAFDVEAEASQQKRNAKEYFKNENYSYTSGFVPGAEPELSFLDPSRRGDPVEIISTKETYPAYMEAAHGTRRARRMNVNNKYAPNIATPLHVLPETHIEHPVLTPVPDVSKIKMPMTKTVPGLTVPPSRIEPKSLKRPTDIPTKPPMPPRAPLTQVPTYTAPKAPPAPFPVNPPIPAPISSMAYPGVNAPAYIPTPIPVTNKPLQYVPSSAPAPDEVKAVKEEQPKPVAPAPAPQVVPVTFSVPIPAAPQQPSEPEAEPIVAMSAPVEKVPVVEKKPKLKYGKHNVIINQTPVVLATEAPVSRPKSEYLITEIHEKDLIGDDAEQVDAVEEAVAVNEPIAEPIAEPVPEPVPEPIPEPVPEPVPAPVPVPPALRKVTTVRTVKPAVTPIEEFVNDDFPEESFSFERPTVEKKPKKEKPQPTAPASPFGDPFVFPTYAMPKAPAAPSQMPAQPTAPAAPAPAPAVPEAEPVFVVKLHDDIKAMYSFSKEDFGFTDDEPEVFAEDTSAPEAEPVAEDTPEAEPAVVEEPIEETPEESAEEPEVIYSEPIEKLSDKDYSDLLSQSSDN